MIELSTLKTPLLLIIFVKFDVFFKDDFLEQTNSTGRPHVYENNSSIFFFLTPKQAKLPHTWFNHTIQLTTVFHHNTHPLGKEWNTEKKSMCLLVETGGKMCLRTPVTGKVQNFYISQVVVFKSYFWKTWLLLWLTYVQQISNSIHFIKRWCFQLFDQEYYKNLRQV